MKDLKRIRRPHRYGRALRRLLEGKTTAVVWHIAQKLEADGLVIIAGGDMSGGSRSSYPCVLTEAGKEAAKAAKEGKNPYAKQAPKVKKPRHFAPKSERRSYDER